MTNRVSRWQARVFRRLVRTVYPAWFRREHGAEMEQWFVSRLAREHGPRAHVRLCHSQLHRRRRPRDASRPLGWPPAARPATA